MILILKICLLIVLTIISHQLIIKRIARDIKSKAISEGRKKSVNLTVKNKYIRISVIAVCIGILSVFAGNGILRSIIFMIGIIVIYFGFERINYNSIKKQVLQDLLNVSQCLRAQISSGISLSIALRSVPGICENKAFSVEMTNLYLEHQLSKYTVINTAKEIERKFNYPEIKMFISAIKQQSHNTSALEAFDNLIEVLKEHYIGYMEDVTNSKVAIMILGVCIVLTNIAALSVYPIIVEASEALKVILM